MENMKRIFTRDCVAKRFLFLLSIAGLIFASLGVCFLCLYYNAPRYSLQSGFSGFGMWSNLTNINTTRFVVEVKVEPLELWFQYSFLCSKNGTYNFLFVFPFYITNKISSTENLHFNATPHGSLVWIKLYVDDVFSEPVKKDIDGRFYILNTFRSGTRGSYMFVLPFRGASYPEVVEDIQRELDIDFHTLEGADISVFFSFPKRYKITQTFPPFSAGPNVSPLDKETMLVEWNFKILQDSVTICCQDENEIATYQNYQFFACLFLGIGIPMGTQTIYEAIKERSSKKERACGG